MERYVWKGKLRPGKIDEYIRRHDQIWSEMSKLLDEAGIHNYTIWNQGDELFGYYECESIDHAIKVQSQSAVVERWNEYMKDVMEIRNDPKAGMGLVFKQVFYHK
jgi:L-rhamnose mutarotase